VDDGGRRRDGGLRHRSRSARWLRRGVDSSGSPLVKSRPFRSLGHLADALGVSAVSSLQNSTAPRQRSAPSFLFAPNEPENLDGCSRSMARPFLRKACEHGGSPWRRQLLPHRSRRKEEPPRCKRRLRCGRSWRYHGLPPCSHALRRKGRTIEWEQPSRFPARSARTKKKAPSVSAAPSSSAERKRLTHRVRRQDARGIETAGS